jgi:hypothetical protein
MSMQGGPRIRLRLIFFIFFCAAFGLAIGTAPVTKNDPLFTIGGWGNVRLNWHYALLAAGSVAVVIGLVKEVAILRSWKARAEIEPTAAASFATAFAIGWRIAIAGLLVICLATAMIVSRQVISLPDSEMFLSYALFPNALWVVCLVIALSVSFSRWRREESKRDPPWKLLAVWLAGTVVAALILPDIGLIHFLVHVATAGIEFAQPVRFQFADGFPDHRAEGFRSFWISVAAAGVIALAILNLVGLLRVRVARGTCAIVGGGSFCLLLMLATGFCVWYYGFELRRISPFLAEVGLASTWLEWTAGFVVASTIITAGAHQAATSGNTHYLVLSSVNDQAERLPIYESIGCLLVFVAAVAVYTFQAINSYVDFSRIFNASRVAEAVVSLLRDPGSILMLALLTLSLQLCWLRWQRRAERVDWTIAAIDQRRFWTSWIALAALTCVAVPTISASVFMFWLGPWYLYGQ